MRGRIQRLLQPPLSGLRITGSRIRQLGNADTALFAGWAMATVGFGLIDVAAGLIAGGVSLAAGALLTARGEG